MRRQQPVGGQGTQTSSLEASYYLKVFGGIGGSAVLLGIILFVVTTVLPDSPDESGRAASTATKEAVEPSEPAVYQPKTRIVDIPGNDELREEGCEEPEQMAAAEAVEPAQPEPEAKPEPAPQPEPVEAASDAPAVTKTGPGASPPEKPEESPPSPKDIEIAGVWSGKVVIQRDILPIDTDQTRVDVQQYLRLTRLPVCHTCRGSGKVKERGVIGQRREGVRIRNVLNSWHTICPKCSCEAQGCEHTCPLRQKGNHTSCERCCGGGTTCRALRFYPHCCGHCCPADSERKPCNRGCCCRKSREPTCSQCETCSDLRDLRAAHAAGGGVCDYCRRSLSCDKMRPGHGDLFHAKSAKNFVAMVDALGHMERGRAFPRIQRAVSSRLRLLFQSRIWRHFEPIWRQVQWEEPSGQPVIARGRLSPTEGPSGPFTYFRLDAEGSSNITIVMAHASDDEMALGKVVLGGLLVGRWMPQQSRRRSRTPVLLAVACAARR